MGIIQPAVSAALLRRGAPDLYNRRPSNAEVLWTTDSREANGWVSTVSLPASPGPQNFMFWANTFGKQRWILRPENNYALAGRTTAAINAALPAALAGSNAAVMPYIASCNDVTTTASSVTRDNISAWLDAVLKAGRWPFVICETPRGLPAGSFNFTGTNLDRHLENTESLKQLARAYGVPCIDIWPKLLDYATANANFLAGLTADEVHLSTAGAMLLGREIEAQIGSWFGPNVFSVQARGERYTAADHPRGPLNANPLMIGSAGTLGSGVTGGAANGCTISVGDPALSVVASKPTVNGREVQRLVVTGTPTTNNGFVQVEQVVPVANLIAGQAYAAVCDFDIAAGYTGLTLPTISIQPTDAAKRQWAPVASSTDLALPSSDRLTGTLVTCPYTHDAAQTAVLLRQRVYFRNGLAASATVDVASMAFKAA